MAQKPHQDWILRKAQPAKKKLRLFCFPYSGGGPSAFRGWAEALPALDVCLVQAPGREARMREAPLTAMSAFVDSLLPSLKPHLDLPFVFFGHSLGGLMIFEVARRLRREGLPMPAHLFPSASPAPHLSRVDNPIHHLPDDALRQKLINYQGTPKEILEHEELMQLVLPVIRADFTIWETYAAADEPPLDVPVTAFGGLTDAEVTRDEVDAWRSVTTQKFSLRMLPGNHFFLHSDRSSLLGALLQDVAALL